MWGAGDAVCGLMALATGEGHVARLVCLQGGRLHCCVLPKGNRSVVDRRI